jgi:hypothetical protein
VITYTLSACLRTVPGLQALPKHTVWEIKNAAPNIQYGAATLVQRAHAFGQQAPLLLCSFSATLLTGSLYVPSTPSHPHITAQSLPPNNNILQAHHPHPSTRFARKYLLLQPTHLRPALRAAPRTSCTSSFPFSEPPTPPSSGRPARTSHIAVAVALNNPAHLLSN